MEKLKKIIKEEITKLKKRSPKKRMLNENKIEWWCNCTVSGCYGTLDMADESVDCSCCDEDCPAEMSKNTDYRGPRKPMKPMTDLPMMPRRR